MCGAVVRHIEESELSKVEYRDQLSNPPIIESLLQVKWGGQDAPDPGYPLVVGRLYDRISNEYPDNVDLPLAMAPANVATQNVRHQFWSANSNWPVVQIGPGVATLNQAGQYHRNDFLKRAVALRSYLEDAYPQRLEVNSLMLQYIDALEFDFVNQDVQSFVRDYLHVDLRIPDELFDFDDRPVVDHTSDLVIKFRLPSKRPSGSAELQISTGHLHGKPAVVWHTTVLSEGLDAVAGWDTFDEWLTSAHGIVHHWFFALIQGDLLKKME